jgi:hypothetical protein
MIIKARTLVIACSITAGVIALPVIFIVATVLVPMSGALRRTQRAEAELQKPALYEPVGRTLALCCQSDIPQGALPVHWLPKGLKELAVGPGYTFIDPGEADVELGGGFHHYGYNLKRDERTSSPGTTVWQLYFESEDWSPEKPPRIR